MDFSKQIIARSKLDPKIELTIIPGHFATSQSHVTNFLEITALKSRCSECKQVAKQIARRYAIDTPVDTILCLDGTKVIGTYLADELTKAGILSYNAHKSLYVISPEQTGNGHLMFRDNMKMAVERKHILVLAGSATTGNTLMSAINTARYYGGIVTGAAAIFSALDSIDGIPVISIFDNDDVPEYFSYKTNECPLCKKGVPIDALINSYGYSEL